MGRSVLTSVFCQYVFEFYIFMIKISLTISTTSVDETFEMLGLLTEHQSGQLIPTQTFLQ